ncbi:chaperonin 10-like protein [Aspergillus karnatakaensis]|uniref:zinc-binding alcohol dehydrogenase family protein n=1 Tax=Aspergillus karnatakaensis TaxID=1810916 RepID=UPI003CCD0299
MSLYTRKPRTPTLAKALLIHGLGEEHTLEHNHPVPTPGPDEVLVRCAAVSLNPVDWQSKTYNFGISSLPWINGRDASGSIESIGRNVTGLSIGDAVFTLTDYTKSNAGSYQEFFVAAATSVARIPSGLGFEQAAAVPVAGVTAGVVLQRYMGIELGLGLKSRVDSNGDGRGGGSQRQWLLIWGGATSTGYMAIQLAKIYGLSVIAVASVRNFEYLKDAGADVVLDRRFPEEALPRVEEVTKRDGGLRLAFDAVGVTTAGFCARILRKDGKNGKDESVLVALAGLPRGVEEDPEFKGLSLPTIKVKVFHNEPEFGAALLKELTTYLSDGRLKPPRVSVLSGGFDAVNLGLLRLRNMEISGTKLVIRVDETRSSSKDMQHELGWL